MHKIYATWWKARAPSKKSGSGQRHYSTNTLGESRVGPRVEIIENEHKYFHIAGQHSAMLMPSRPPGREWRCVLWHWNNTRKTFESDGHIANREQSSNTFWKKVSSQNRLGCYSSWFKFVISGKEDIQSLLGPIVQTRQFVYSLPVMPSLPIRVYHTGRISADAAGGLIGRKFGPKKEKLKYLAAC